MQNPGESTKATSRRRFLGGAAAGAAGLALTAPHVLAGAISSPPAEKLNIAGVGIGGMGHGNMRGLASENIVALCDVDQRHAAGCYRSFPQAKKYKDYRLMLEKQKDIDAVMVATPDHMHAPPSMMAIQMGKHVYCEKPLTHTVYEARKLAEAARAKRVATQMGNRGQASEGTRQISEWLAAGVIGPVREVHIWTDRPLRGIYEVYWPQGVPRPADKPAVPDWLDWDLWLGVATGKRPYNPSYLPFKWRGWWDFGTGALGDIGCHAFDAAVRALKLGSPDTVEACSSLVNEETYPVAAIVTYEFPARGELPPVRLTWYDGGLRPPRPAELEDGGQLGSYTNGCLYIGDEGKIMSGGAGTPPSLIPVAKMKDFKAPPKTLPRSIGHYQEFIAAAKGGKPAGSDFAHAGPLTEMVLLGNIALRRSMKAVDKLGVKKLRWDGKNMKFLNEPAADAYVHKEYRKGYTL